MHESCHSWMSDVTYEWVVPHMKESCHLSMMSNVTYQRFISHFTYEWFKSHMTYMMSHVTYTWFMSSTIHTMSHVRYEQSKFHTTHTMGHVTHERHVTSHTWHAWSIMSHINDSSQIRRSHSTHKWVTSQIWISCSTRIKCAMSHVRMSHATHMNKSFHNMNESCHICINHVTRVNESCQTYERVVSHLNESCHSYGWVNINHVTYMIESFHLWMSHVT